MQHNKQTYKQHTYLKVLIKSSGRNNVTVSFAKWVLSMFYAQYSNIWILLNPYMLTGSVHLDHNSNGIYDGQTPMKCFGFKFNPPKHLFPGSLQYMGDYKSPLILNLKSFSTFHMYTLSFSFMKYIFLKYMSSKLIYK